MRYDRDKHIEGKAVVVSDSSANVRVKPLTVARILGHFPEGKAMGIATGFMCFTNEKWIEIRIKSEKEKIDMKAWVRAEVVKLV